MKFDRREITTKRDYFLNRFEASPEVYASYWSVLSSKEKIDFILDAPPWFVAHIAERAAIDPCEFVRMLAFSPEYGRAVGADIVQKALREDSDMVKAAVYANHNWREGLEAMNQKGKLLILSLSRRVSGGDFLIYIEDQIKNQKATTDEIAQLVSAFVCNPLLMEYYTDAEKIEDGLDFVVINAAFQKWWLFTKEAPQEVTDVIAWQFPLGHRNIQGIPEEVIVGLVEEALAWRNYGPLVRKVRESPERFSEAVRRGVRQAEKGS